MSRTLNRKAWGVLREDEKAAITLKHVDNKSTWQAGEIMDKSHYKFLEISYRATRYLQIFTEYYELYDDLIPGEVTGNPEIKQYFILTMEQRLKLPEVGQTLNRDYGFSSIATRERDIIEQMEKWHNSTNAYEQALYELIKEFDRWNNFRILPPSIQEPSAYKRRVKNVYKRHIKVVTNIPEISIPKIISLFSSKGKGLYLPLISKDKQQIYIIKVKASKNTHTTLTELNLYLFHKEKTAQEYIEAIYNYIKPKSKKCKDGLDFWPKYRELIKLAENYDEIQKIVPHRKQLQLALSKLAFI